MTTTMPNDPLKRCSRCSGSGWEPLASGIPLDDLDVARPEPLLAPEVRIRELQAMLVEEQVYRHERHLQIVALERECEVLRRRLADRDAQIARFERDTARLIRDGILGRSS